MFQISSLGEAMRYLILAVVACALGGCASSTVVENPQTKEKVSCGDPLVDFFNPWSQTKACVGDHVAQGWVPVDE